MWQHTNACQFNPAPSENARTGSGCVAALGVVAADLCARAALPARADAAVVSAARSCAGFSPAARREGQPLCWKLRNKEKALRRAADEQYNKQRTPQGGTARGFSWQQGTATLLGAEVLERDAAGAAPAADA